MSGYKINLHKSITFLYTTNKHTEKDFMDTLLVTIASKKRKYQGINLTKEVEDLYNESFKLLKKDKDTRKRKTILCSCVDRINFVKIAILPEAICRSSAIPIKILPSHFLQKQKKLPLKFLQNHRRSRIENP